MSHEVLEEHWIRHACGHWFHWGVIQPGDHWASRLMAKSCPECIVREEGEGWKATLILLMKKRPDFLS